MAAVTQFFVDLPNELAHSILLTFIRQKQDTTPGINASCLRQIFAATDLLASFGIRFEERESDQSYIQKLRERISLIKTAIAHGPRPSLEDIIEDPIKTAAVFERLKKIEIARAFTEALKIPLPQPYTEPQLWDSIRKIITSSNPKNIRFASLSLRNRSLFHLPYQVCILPATCLDISDNYIQCLPPEIGAMENLDTLYASGNPIKWVPEQLQSLKNLRFLTIDFEYGVGDQVMVWLRELEKRTGLLSRVGIIIPEDGQISAATFLRHAILRLDDIAQFCKEPKSPAVLLVQPQALEGCLKRALESGYL